MVTYAFSIAFKIKPLGWLRQKPAEKLCRETY